MKHCRKITLESLNLTTKQANNHTFLLSNDKAICRYHNSDILDIEISHKFFIINNELINNAITNFLNITKEDLKAYIDNKIISITKNY